MAPQFAKAWFVEGKDNAEFDGLTLKNESPVTQPSEHEVLVKFHAAALNYRDLLITRAKYPLPHRQHVTPGSDGAGEVVAVGSKVTLFKPGDKVVTLFNQGHQAGELNHKSIATGLGGVLSGTLRQYGTFHENGLVDMPPSLSYREGATLTCAGVTAWNCLYGSKPLTAGDVVLTQGTGGVSIFALQFAKAAGATVIATTSSEKKAQKLKELGADHIINYKDTPNWGEKAKEFTFNGEGVDHIVEVGGPSTIAQSFKAIKIGGVVSIVGFIGGKADSGQPGFMEVLANLCTVRGVLVGSKLQFEQMNRSIEANKIKPIVDDKVFKLEELKKACQYMWEQKHFSKVAIEID